VLLARRAEADGICLISALAFHRMTSRVPHAVYLAIAAEIGRPGRIGKDT
jgi:predicted transcriptional regulator of viral defense system